MNEASRPRERFLLRTGLCLSGPLVWALHFGAVYGLGHVGCTTALDEGQPLRDAVIMATLIALLGVAILFAISWRLQARIFYRPVTFWLLALSAFGILAAGMAAIFLPACPSLR